MKSCGPSRTATDKAASRRRAGPSAHRGCRHQHAAKAGDARGDDRCQAPWPERSGLAVAAIARRGTQLEMVLIAQIDGVADVVLQDGRTLTMTGLFTQPRTLMSSLIAEQLGWQCNAGGVWGASGSMF